MEIQKVSMNRLLLPAFILLSVSLSPGAVSDPQTRYPIPSGYPGQAVASNRNGIDVIVGGHGSMARRTNGGAWNFFPTTNPADNLLDIVFANGKFVAVATTVVEGVTFGVALTSTDGLNWERHAIPQSVEVKSITFGKSKFVVSGFAPGGDPHSYTSPDGETWTPHNISEVVTVELGVVRFVAGRFVAGPTLTDIFTSDNAIDWTPADTPTASVAHTSIQGIAAKANRVVAVGGAGGAQAAVVSTDGGLTWSGIEFGPGNGAWTEVVYNPAIDLFVAVGWVGGKELASYSTNGVTWQTASINRLGEPSSQLNAVCIAKDGKMITAGAIGAYVAGIGGSTDGQSWSIGYYGRYSWNSSLYFDGNYYMVGGIYSPLTRLVGSYGGAILKSRNGLDWQKVAAPAHYMLSIARSSSTFIALGGVDFEGTSPKFYRSENGTSWSKVTGIIDAAGLRDVTYGHGKFVAVGTDILLSGPGGGTWTPVGRPAATGELKAVTFATHDTVPTFIAVGAGPAIIRSVNDGQTWQNVTPDLSGIGSNAGTFGFSDVCYGNGKFLAVADGFYCTSSNGGRTWTVTNVSTFYHSQTACQAGPSEFYVTSNIQGTDRIEYTALVARDPVTLAVTDTSVLSPDSHSLTVRQTTLIAGEGYTTGGITRLSTRPVVSLSQDAFYEENEASAAAFVFTRSGSKKDPLTVKYTMSGTATSGTDYQALSGSAIIPAGASKIKVPVKVTNDTEVEPIETIICTLASNSKYVIGEPAKTTLTVRDDDVPTFNFDVASASVTEGDSLEVVLKRNTSVGTATVNLTRATGSTATASSDYDPFPSSVSFAAGSLTTSFTLQTNSDNLSETAELLKIQLSLGPTQEGKAGTRSLLTVTINDPVSSGAPVTVTAVQNSITEGTFDLGTFRISRTDTTEEIFVNFAVTGTAVSGTDYTPLTSPAQLPAGVANVDIVVFSSQDSAVEGNETVRLTITSGSGYSVGTPSSAVVTIVDDDD